MHQTDDTLTLAQYNITVASIDTVLASIASKIRFSGPDIKNLENGENMKDSRSIQNVYKMLYSRDAKWLTRMVLKDFSCLELPETMVYAAFDPRLPTAMRMYDDFRVAISELKDMPASQMACISRRGWNKDCRCAEDPNLLVPRIGVKVGRATRVKARGGVKHAVSMIEGRTTSIERKYDGEYCQIHIDLSKGEDFIKIFSKSCKDSTHGRNGVHQAIKEGLRIGSKDCGFSRNCILEGELLVWSDKSNDILEFHKIRKHVSRSGIFIGTKEDSQYVR